MEPSGGPLSHCPNLGNGRGHKEEPLLPLLPFCSGADSDSWPREEFPGSFHLLLLGVPMHVAGYISNFIGGSPLLRTNTAAGKWEGKRRATGLFRT